MFVVIEKLLKSNTMSEEAVQENPENNENDTPLDSASHTPAETNAFSDHQSRSPSAPQEEMESMPSASQTPEPTQINGKRPREDDEIDPTNPADVKREKHRKKVSGRVIDKLWSKLDPESAEAMERLCKVAMTKVFERFQGSPNEQEKIAETQKVLTNHWLSTLLSKSFLARLNTTKLPPVKSLHTKMKGITSQEFEPLGPDSMLHTKSLFDAYLLAEKSQLQELKAYYASVKSACEEDKKYLNDFKKTTASLETQNAKAEEERKRQLHLDDPDLKPEDPDDEINLVNPPVTLPAAQDSLRFDPDEDPEIRLLLEKLQKKLDEKTPAAERAELLKVCDELDEFQAKLDQGRLFGD